MKILILAFALAATSLAASAQQYVQGYTRADGTYVQGYYRSSPNNTKLDNYSTRGNVNPYTGAVGTRDPYYTPPVRTYSYSAPVYTPPVYQAPVYRPPWYQAPGYQTPTYAQHVDQDGGGDGGERWQ